MNWLKLIIRFLLDFVNIARNDNTVQKTGSVVTALAIAGLVLSMVQSIIATLPTGPANCPGNACADVTEGMDTTETNKGLESPDSGSRIENGEDTGPVGFIHRTGEVLFAALTTPLGCAGGMNATQRTYASIGLDTLSCATACGLQWGQGAIAGEGVYEGTVNGDAALACLVNCASAKGLQVVTQLLKDVATGATGGGWFGSAEQTNTHNPVYRVRVVKAL